MKSYQQFFAALERRHVFLVALRVSGPAAKTVPG
jgi:hypothetical protein